MYVCMYAADIAMHLCMYVQYAYGGEDYVAVTNMRSCVCKYELYVWYVCLFVCMYVYVCMYLCMYV
jgi:hypothetical protein